MNTIRHKPRCPQCGGQLHRFFNGLGEAKYKKPGKTLWFCVYPCNKTFEIDDE